MVRPSQSAKELWEKIVKSNEVISKEISSIAFMAKEENHESEPINKIQDEYYWTMNAPDI